GAGGLPRGRRGGGGGGGGPGAGAGAGRRRPAGGGSVGATPPSRRRVLVDADLDDLAALVARHVLDHGEGREVLLDARQPALAGALTALLLGRRLGHPRRL